MARSREMPPTSLQVGTEMEECCARYSRRRAFACSYASRCTYRSSVILIRVPCSTRRKKTACAALRSAPASLKPRLHRRWLECSSAVEGFEAFGERRLCRRQLGPVRREADSVSILGHLFSHREVVQKLGEQSRGDPSRPATAELLLGKPLSQWVLRMKLPEQAQDGPAEILIDLPMEVSLSVPPRKPDDPSSSQELSKLTLQGLGVQADQGLEARGREG